MAGEKLPERRRRQLYGRRKGPKLSQHQASLFETLLPQLALSLEPGRNPRGYFAPNTVEDVWLEIGFGGGEHLHWQAQHHPNIGLIGAEPYEGGVAKLLSKLAPSASPGVGRYQHLPHASHGGGRIEADASPSSPVSKANGGGGERSGAMRDGGGLADHTRIYQGDARDVIEGLPPDALGCVFILFPDPWPKTRHHKRRFIQMDMLDGLARVMKPGATMRFASDDPGYVAWTLERLLAHPAFAWTATCAGDWKCRPQDWPPTRYEEKALRGPPAFLEFHRR